jgi:hypothetical protein
MTPGAVEAGKLEAGEKLLPEEMTLLHEAMIELKRPNTFMAEVLDKSASGASLAVELAATAGLYTAMKKGAVNLAQKGLQKLLTRTGLKEVEEMAAKQVASNATKGAWKNLPAGVRIKQVGNYFIKEVNPDASALGRWWGRGSLNAQSKALGKLGDMAPSHVFKDGRLVMRDAGAYTPGNFWSTWWKGSMRLKTPFNDIRPRNIGAGGIIFDPAKHPIQQGLEATAVGTAGGTAAILYNT